MEIPDRPAGGGTDKDGNFPADSVNGRVEHRLLEFAERARAFHTPGEAEEKKK
jgi:hypothetical protein